MNFQVQAFHSNGSPDYDLWVLMEIITSVSEEHAASTFRVAPC